MQERTSNTNSILPKELTRNNGVALPIPCGQVEAREPATVELIRDGDRVVAMIVRCGCGNTTKVSCEYE